MVNTSTVRHSCSYRTPLCFASAEFWHYGMTDEALVPLYEELVSEVRPALILSHHNERSAKASGFK